MVNLPFPKIGKDAIDYTLPDDSHLGQWIVPKGTVVKLLQTRNFGYCVLLEGCLDKRGFVIPQRIFRY